MARHGFPILNGPVLLTGGAGFVGSHVAQALMADGLEVHVLDDLSTGSLRNLPAGAHFHRADVRDEATLREVFASTPFVGIVHCAAQTSVARSMAEPTLDREINVGGTCNLALLAREHGVSRFVFISSGGAVYGETECAATEQTPAAPMSHYGRNKLAAEWTLRATGVPYAILRPANIYGPGQRADLEGGVVAVFLERLLAGQPLSIYGDGLQSRDFVYVQDVVAAVRAGLATTHDVIWNVASGASTTVLELLSLLKELTESSADVTFGPTRAGDVRHSILSPAALLETGAWGPPRSLREGLRQLVEARLSQQESAATA